MVVDLCDDVIELILHHKNAMLIQKKWREHKTYRIMRYERWKRFKVNKNKYSCTLDYKLSDFTEMTYFVMSMMLTGNHH